MHNPLYLIELTQHDVIKINLDVDDNVKSAARYYLWTTLDGVTPGKLLGASNFLLYNKNYSISKDWELDPGRYLIMPATFEPNKLGSFKLMAFSVKETCKLSAL